MKSKLTHLFLALTLILLLSSCRNNAEVERAIQTFFIFVLQLVSFLLFGTPSIILSVVGSTSKKDTPKIIGSILLGVFTLVSISCFVAIQDINPKRDYIYFAFLVDAVVIGVSLYFLTKSKKVTVRPEVVTDEYLDKIIEDKEITSPESKEDDTMEII